ncbi:single-stranded-DNA-specific exonuclease RecJ [Desulforamulus ferrireducens]|uniref:Single-stranded-DNA-specific exonuclease RecJ n=1 Tax=Desulforamulus ferrireducens TaxID=1833852 RepID=A0A1S6IUB4_9FIRM|nr:single-stranded-DNA-specific exonuclease RecJ [Desulforamulus ferrireducens]AQS58359.1 single-stranded-DNA-specific exonuclease RecJ [Desulforamulus ferrireducens]
MHRSKVWRVKAPNPALQQILSWEVGISKVLAQLLINRGIYTVDQAKAFLGSELDRMFSPWLMKDMDKAVERVLAAKAKGEQILVYGDYDVDGITGTSVLVLALRQLGCRVNYFIPLRLEEGYGLNKDALERAVEQGVSLIVTVDCGISGAEEVAAAKALGLDVLITDHHEPPTELPQAVAVVNPKRRDCSYPFKELAGVGVALKLIQALYQRAGLAQSHWEEYLDLVCLGTVADIVPLQGENRILVKHGLNKIINTKRPGLQALIKVSGIKSENIGTRELGFGLAPRLNAAGRMGDASLGVELLLTSDPTVAEQLAEQLNKGNQERQQVEAGVLTEALAMVEADPQLANSKVLVLASENWHPGVIGIVASRLVDRFYRPVFMISLEEGKGKGSARSIPGFNLYQAMVSCQDYFDQFGGHAMAAGFSIPENKIADFRQALNQLAEEILTEEHLTPNLDLDALISLNELSIDTVQELDQLSPYGHANPGPILGCCEATVLNCREVGKNGGHLKMRVREEQVVLDGIGFNLASYSEMLATQDTVDLAFIPSINVWNGRSSVQLEVKEFKEVGEVATLQEEVESCQELHQLLNKTLQLPEQEVLGSLVPQGILNLYRPAESVCLTPNDHANMEINVELEDYRNYPDRMAQLMQLLDRQVSSLILVESTAQAIQIGTKLSKTTLVSDGFAVYHPLLGVQEVKQLSEQLQTGKIKVLVSTSPAPCNYYQFAQVIMFYLPYQPKECWLRNPGQTKLVLLGGPSLAAEAAEQLQALAPERELLGELFKLIKAKIDAQGKGQITLEELCLPLRTFSPRIASHTVELALTIFQELGIVQYSKQGNVISYQIDLSVRSDLRNSQTYQWALHTKEECLRFQREYLSAKPEKLLQLFTRS